MIDLNQFVENSVLKIQKNNVFCQLLQNQKSVSLMDDYSAGKLRTKKTEETNNELNEYVLKNNDIYEMLKKIRDEYPQYNQIFDSLAQI